MSKQFWIGTAAALAVTVAAAAAGWTFIVQPSRVDAPPLPSYDVVDENGKVVGQYTIPSDDLIVKEPDAEAIMYGKRLLNETARLLPENVGAGLNCNSCHLAQGKLDKGAPYINAYNFYPRVMPRAGKEVNLTMRINGCFQRSMNGKPLDPKSEEMGAMIAYMKWLGQGLPKEHMVKVEGAGKLDETLVPNADNGKAIYATQCAVCHGNDGEGKKDQFGDYTFPPLWGDDSFNIGAGMARTYKAAAFVKYNMPVSVHLEGPLGQGGLLTDQEAIDVSEYFTHMPRPDFAGKVKDWPNSKKPKDARY